MTATRTTTVDDSDDADHADSGGPQRRRGAALEDAIRSAAFAELTEVGYLAFSVEAVAARARTGKASIYRRWPTKQELVLDALCVELPSPAQCGIHVAIPDDVSTVDALRELARNVGRTMCSPAGAAMRAIKCEAATDPELAALVDERFQAPRRAAMLELLRRGVARGEVRPEAATQLVADVIPAMIGHRVILQREAITERDITDLVEQVLIPLISVR